MNPVPQSYTSLLLEDIQNFHQKNTNTTQPSISLPACLSKACSILEAVADLNSTTSSNFSAGAFSEDKKTPSLGVNANNDSNHYAKKRVEPFMESEVVVFDDVMEPSLHKYVTVKRGGSVCGVGDMEDQESSGSNSFITHSGQIQQQNHWGISSNTWEANSADSTDCWSSRLMEGSDAVAEARKALNCKKKECDDHQHSGGIGRGRLSGSSSSSSSKVLNHHKAIPVAST
ncbi:hypothetical protein PIB30_117366 [Stylosanthes scabra]|nr:hypothetical protein [Stylosanthes scabra]